jgi:hypothetical protein
MGDSQRKLMNGGMLHAIFAGYTSCKADRAFINLDLRAWVGSKPSCSRSGSREIRPDWSYP